MPNFDTHRAEFDQAVYVDIQNRTAKLLVWFQAEKTSPYPLPLLRQELELGERLRLADLLAIPSDVGSWRRFCNWVLDSLPRLPVERFWDAFQSLSVWQNLWSGRKNRTSTRIVAAAADVLHELEALESDQQDDEELARQRWRGLSSRERRKLASMLRGLVLRAAETDTDQVRAYLCNRQHTERPRVGDGDEVLLHAPVLAGPLPDELVDYSLFVWRDRLPVDAMRHRRSAYRNMFRGIEDRDWDRLGLTELARYGSAAPTREPFKALFRLAPDAGRRLVRELANHAITSWRQLNRLSARRRGTPIPLTLQFPWGEQRFWGGPQEYQWAVGQWAPKPVGSGLMALTQWAFAAVDGGDPVDEVIRQVLEGHQCVGALHVACVLAMKTTTISPTTIALFTSQRIWHWDINRWVQARQGLASNLIGFQPGEEVHAKAVQQINERETALGDIRLLTLTCHLRGGELANRSAALVRAFEGSPAFDTHEERMDSGTAASRSRTAQDWAQCGHLENYRFRETPDGRSIEVSIEKAAEQSEDVDAEQARYTQRLSTVPLQLWTGKYFKSGAVPDSMTIQQAVAAAKAFDRADLFSSGYSHSDGNKDVQGVVAGVAAVVCAEDFESELEWATQVCLRALHTPEGQEDYFAATSILSNHPVQNALHGVGALLKRLEGEDARHVQVALTSFVAHPYELVGLKALEGLLGAWERHPDIGWNALHLATELSLIDMRRVNTRDHDESDQARRERLVQVAMDRLDARHTSPEALVAIPALPVHWLLTRNGQGPQRRSPRSLRTTSRSAQWLPNPCRCTSTSSRTCCH
ncbi:hypothetical protein ACQ86G_08475 [Roseateles chitinivorans]|uniref:hypothetical protein n=1 Tax=Roseateles chitinivorans TaxID=2917965 RepID=UPI003D66E743